MLDLVNYHVNMAQTRTSADSFGGRHGAQLAAHHDALMWLSCAALQSALRRQTLLADVSRVLHTRGEAAAARLWPGERAALEEVAKEGDRVKGLVLIK